MKYKKEWYRPREISKLGLIKNSVASDNEESNRLFILKLIRNNILPAKNYGLNPKFKYYLVHRDEIEKYNKLKR